MSKHPAIPANLAAHLATATAVLSASAGTDDLLLRMQDDGTFVYGPDDVEVEDGSTWAIAPTSLRMGYQAWSRKGDRDRGKSLLGEKTAGLGETPVHIDDLNPDLEWDEVAVIHLACVSGEDTGTQVRYKASSMGGRRAIAKAFQSITHRAAQGEVKIVPVCELKSESYRNKKFNRTIHNPVFDILSWTTLDAVEIEDEEEAAEEAVPAIEAPKARRSAKPEPAPEPEPEPEPTATRRRRRTV